MRPSVGKPLQRQPGFRFQKFQSSPDRAVVFQFALLGGGKTAGARLGGESIGPLQVRSRKFQLQKGSRRGWVKARLFALNGPLPDGRRRILGNHYAHTLVIASFPEEEQGESYSPKSKTFTWNGNSGLMKLVKANDKIENPFSTLTLS